MGCGPLFNSCPPKARGSGLVCFRPRSVISKTVIFCTSFHLAKRQGIISYIVPEYPVPTSVVETMGALVCMCRMYRCTGRYIGMCRTCLFASGWVRAHAIGISRMSRPKPIGTFVTRWRLSPLTWRQFPIA